MPYSFYSFLTDKDISRVFQSRLFKIFDSLIFTNFPISQQVGNKRRAEAWYYETLMFVHLNRLKLETLFSEGLLCFSGYGDVIGPPCREVPWRWKSVRTTFEIPFGPNPKEEGRCIRQKNQVHKLAILRLSRVKRIITFLQKIFWMLLQSWTWTQLRLQRGAW